MPFVERPAADRATRREVNVDLLQDNESDASNGNQMSGSHCSCSYSFLFLALELLKEKVRLRLRKLHHHPLERRPQRTTTDYSPPPCGLLILALAVIPFCISPRAVNDPASRPAEWRPSVSSSYQGITVASPVGELYIGVMMLWSRRLEKYTSEFLTSSRSP